MRLIIVIMVVFFWIAVWNLSDIYTSDWTDQQRINLYLGMLAVIGVMVLMDPSLIRHF
jgi:hypothetical protein